MHVSESVISSRRRRSLLPHKFPLARLLSDHPDVARSLHHPHFSTQREVLVPALSMAIAFLRLLILELPVDPLGRLVLVPLLVLVKPILCALLRLPSHPSRSPLGISPARPALHRRLSLVPLPSLLSASPPRRHQFLLGRRWPLFCR